MVCDRKAGMEYLKCVRCGLDLRPRPARVQIKHCPRCLARSATMSPLVRAAEPLSPAVGWVDRAADAATAAAEPRANPRRAGVSRRASQGVLAAAVRDMRSQGRMRPAR
jgi:hypothetical protein